MTVDIKITKSDREVDFFEKSKKIIYKNISNPEFSLNDLAREMYISTRQIQRIFLKNGSKGFRHELHLARMRAASYYLKNSNDPVNIIANRVGFLGPMHFAKAFRRHANMSPTEWRKSHAN
jgi:transcriptional regulator GlxA family with amidase domain